MNIWKHVMGVGCALLMLSAARAAHAQRPEPADNPTRSAASTLGYAGVEAFEAGDFAGASERLEQAYALLKVPSLGLWSARALEKLGRLVRASERYAEVTSLHVSSGDVAIQKRAQRDAARELAGLRPRIAHLVIAISGAPSAEVAVSVDEIALTHAQRSAKVALDPGRHVIEGRMGTHIARSEIRLAEGQHASVELRFAGTLLAPDGTGAAHAQAGGDPWRTVGWVAIGVGAASLTAGAVLGVSLLQDRDHFDSSDACDLDRNQCWLEERERAESYNTKRVLSSIGLIAGGALAATGAYLVFFRSEPEDNAAHVALHVAPDSVVVQGRF
jgi:hypothetical protein